MARALAQGRDIPVAPEVRITGDRRSGRYLIELRGRPVWLPCGLFCTLCELAIARTCTPLGYVSGSPLKIYRLRRLLAATAGAGLIETGAGQEYRLTCDRAAIEIDPSVQEVPSPGVLAEDEKSALLALRAPGEIGAQSV
jgi:hypothetical protein